MDYEALLRGIAWAQNVWALDRKRRKLPQKTSYEVLRGRGDDYWLHLEQMTEVELGKEVIDGFLNTREWMCRIPKPSNPKGADVLITLKKAVDKLPALYASLGSQQIGDINFQSYNALAIISFIYATFCQVKPKFGPTATSKVMHMALPNLFMMWDKDIRKGYGVPPDLFGPQSYIAFLMLMQENIRHIKETCPESACMTDQELCRIINRQCGYDNLTMTRLMDIANYAVGHPEMKAPAIKCQKCIEMTNRNLNEVEQAKHLAELMKTLRIGRYR